MHKLLVSDMLWDFIPVGKDQRVTCTVCTVSSEQPELNSLESSLRWEVLVLKFISIDSKESHLMDSFIQLLFLHKAFSEPLQLCCGTGWWSWFGSSGSLFNHTENCSILLMKVRLREAELSISLEDKWKRWCFENFSEFVCRLSSNYICFKTCSLISSSSFFPSDGKFLLGLDFMICFHSDFPSYTK